MSKRWFLAASLCLAGCSLFGGGGDDPPAPVVPPFERPPEKIALAFQVAPATGLSATDFQVTGPVSDEPGEAEVEAYGARTGMILAVPREGSAAEAKCSAGCFYLSPAMGTFRVAKTTSGHLVDTTSPAAVDATTTLVALALMHPSLAHPFPPVAAAEVRWMLEKLEKGWPAATQAIAAFDAAVAAGRPPHKDPAFLEPLKTAVSEAIADMPAWEPVGGDSSEIVESAQELNGTPFAIKHDRVQVSTVEKGDDAGKTTLTAGTRVGTALDYYYEIRALDPATFPDLLESEAFDAVNALSRLPATRTLATGFVPARPYFSYLDVVGNVLTYVSAKIGETSGLAPSSAVPLEKNGFYDVRFLSGGCSYGNSETDAAFVSKHFAVQARLTFQHNLVMAGVEVLSLIPGADKLLGDEAGKKVLLAAIQQAAVEVEGLLSSKDPGDISGDDIYAVFYGTLKAAIDKLVEQASEQQVQAGWRRVLTWVKAGAEESVETVMGLPGKIAKGGSLANRAARLLRPHSLTEYHVAALGYETPNAFTLAVDEKLHGMALDVHGNNVYVRVTGSVRSQADKFQLTAEEAKCNPMGEFLECSMTVRGAVGAVGTAVAASFTYPRSRETETTIPGKRVRHKWLGYDRTRGAYRNVLTDSWVHDSFKGNTYYSTGKVELFGAAFAATGTIENTTFDASTGLEVGRTKTHVTYRIVFQ